MNQPEWFDVVLRLCRNGFDPDGPATGGAQVQVFDRNDSDRLVYRQPIAREVRLDNDEPLLWFRQIVDEGPQFDPEVCRPRSVFTTGVTVDGDRITFPQPQATTGEYAIILPADPDQISVLNAWDTWKLTAISAEEEAVLDALTDY